MHVSFISANKIRIFKDKQLQSSAKAGSNGFVPLPNILIEKLEYIVYDFPSNLCSQLTQLQKAARHSPAKMTTTYFSASQLGLEEIVNTMENFLSQLGLLKVDSGP